MTQYYENIFGYKPSEAAAILFAALFGVSTIIHLIQLVRSRTWYFVPFVIGCLCEVVAYIVRIFSIRQAPLYTLNPFVVQLVLVLVAPPLFSASIYMILGRVIRMVDAEHLSIIRTTWMTKIFVFTDLFSFFMQGGGGAIIGANTNNPEGIQTGQHVIVGGLGIQLLAFCVFILACALFDWRIRRAPTPASLNNHSRWRQFIVVLYLESALILWRSVFRLVEYISGYQSNLRTEEVWTYVFDAALMLFCMVLFNVFHPSKIVAGHVKTSQNPSQNPSEYDVETAAREPPQAEPKP